MCVLAGVVRTGAGHSPCDALYLSFLSLSLISYGESFHHRRSPVGVRMVVWGDLVSWLFRIGIGSISGLVWVLGSGLAVVFQGGRENLVICNSGLKRSGKKSRLRVRAVWTLSLGCGSARVVFGNGIVLVQYWPRFRCMRSLP